MPATVVLNSCTFTAARIHRIGGQLTYNDDLLPLGTEAVLAHALSGVASIILDDGRLVPILLSDIADNTFKFIGELSKLEAQQAIINGGKHEVILGNKITVARGMVIRRTGRPFMSLREHTVDHNDNLTIDCVDKLGVWYDTSSFRLRRVAAYYLTDAYFSVVE